MKLDLIHDIQKAYRKLIDSQSRPGLISDLKDEAGKIDIRTGCLNASAVLVQMLFDTEVKFKVYSQNETEVTKLINQLTYAKAAEASEADFIFILLDARETDLREAMKQAYPGNLLDPHKSATIIIEVDELTNDSQLILNGPGIEKERHVAVKTKWLETDWVELRAEKNTEYPLGIDIILTDRYDKVLCIPRTTKISKMVVG